MRRLVAVLLTAWLCATLFADNGSTGTPSGADGSAGAETGGEHGAQQPEPAPYEQDEFPPFLHAVRRFEIITLGSFPVTAVFSYLVYGFVRYAASDFEPDYSPIGSTNPVPYAQEEHIGVLAVAGSAALLIALVDFIIGEVRGEPE